jgi:hypothetical protein
MSEGLAFPKPRPRLLEKRAQRADLMATDRAERQKCRLRSGGQCEVIIATFRPEQSVIMFMRCRRSASHNHHLLGGRGQRNIGRSIFSTYRLDVCPRCHREITNHVLMPIRDDYATEAATVRYERLR